MRSFPFFLVLNRWLKPSKWRLRPSLRSEILGNENTLVWKTPSAPRAALLKSLARLRVAPEPVSHTFLTTPPRTLPFLVFEKFALKSYAPFSAARNSAGVPAVMNPRGPAAFPSAVSLLYAPAAIKIGAWPGVFAGCMYLLYAAGSWPPPTCTNFHLNPTRLGRVPSCGPPLYFSDKAQPPPPLLGSSAKIAHRGQPFALPLFFGARGTNVDRAFFFFVWIVLPAFPLVLSNHARVRPLRIMLAADGRGVLPREVVLSLESVDGGPHAPPCMARRGFDIQQYHLQRASVPRGPKDSFGAILGTRVGNPALHALDRLLQREKLIYSNFHLQIFH